MTEPAIKVLLVDDHAIARNGVRLMLSSEGDIEIAGEAGDWQQALAQVRAHDFSVVLCDIGLPGKNGLEVLRLLRAEKPRLPVLMLSTYAEDVYAVRALKLGAAGYLTKDCPTAVLVAAVRKAAAGGKYLSPALSEQIAGMIGGSGGAGHGALSNRELEVLRCLAAGDSLVKIGEELHLSPSTVTTYRTRILQKLGLGSNAELTRYAIEHGLA
jgi:DNA-binding NarL/FixJ family response regulator